MTDVAATVRWHARRIRSIPRRPVVWYRHRPFEPTDVVIAEYPKSGETWLNFMLAEIVFGEPVGFDSVKRFIPGVGLGREPALIPGSAMRIWKTHERPRPEYRRAVYLVRHVGDVAVSYYNFLVWKKRAPGDFKTFLRRFLRSRVDPYGPWQEHVASWLDVPDIELHVVRYEDLRRDTAGVLTGILGFLGVEAQERTVLAAIEGNTIEAMREKERRARADLFEKRDYARGGFVRKGTTGESRAWLDAEDERLIERTAGAALHRLGYPIVPGDELSKGGSVTPSDREA
jgi:sulfotransferase family protein